MLNIAVRLFVFAAVFAVLWGAVGVFSRWQDLRAASERKLRRGDATSSITPFAESRTGLIAAALGVLIAAGFVFLWLVPWGVRFLAARGVECFT